MDELNANTEGTASPSPSDVGATGASGADANQGQVVESSPQEQTAPESTPEEFSAGWTFDEETQPEASIPENDDDIQGMLNDPNLDQTRAPGVVEALKSARAEARQSNRELKQVREQLAQLEQFGGIEGVSQTMSIVSGLIHNPETGTLPFWQAIAKDAQPAYWASVQTLAQHAPEDLIAALQEAGKLPDVQAQAAANQLTAEDWARIPQELHDIARQIPVNELINWLDNGNDETLKMMLSTQKELSELKGARKEQAEKEWRTAVQQAQAAGQQAVETLSEQFEQAHYKQLAKWQPFGPNDPQNQFLYRSILEGAHRMLLDEPQFRQMFQDAVDKLQQAPLKRLRNDHLAADAEEREARALAARYNARLGQTMKGMVQKLDSVFKDARAYREEQRQSIPERREIPGQSSTAANGHKGSALDENGRISASFMSNIKRNLGIGG